MSKRLLIVSLFIFFQFMSVNSIAGNTDWIQGDWLHTYDPDGDTQDRLSFRDGGQFTTTEVSTGKSINGMYFLKGNEVHINLVYQGKIFMKLNGLIHTITRNF